MRILDVLRKRLALLGTLILCIVVLGGCLTWVDPDRTIIIEDDTILVPDGQVVTDEIVTLENILDFVSLGQHRGVEFDSAFVPVTDEDVEDWINTHLSQATELVLITDRPVINGDTVVIDFEGLLDGVPFEGGTAENFNLLIGSGQFIPGFEEQIIGRYAGEEFYIDIAFPEVYHAPALAGQDAVFRINLVSIYVEAMPELTDEFVQEQLGLESVEYYKTLVRTQLELQNANMAENSARSQVWNAIVNDSIILKYPLHEIERMMERDFTELARYAEMYDMELETLISLVSDGMDLDDFIEAEIRPAAFRDVGQDLILRAVAAQEGIVITDDEFNEAIATFVADFNYESKEEFLEINGEHAVRISLLAERVIEVIMQHAVER